MCYACEKPQYLKLKQLHTKSVLRCSISFENMHRNLGLSSKKEHLVMNRFCRQGAGAGGDPVKRDAQVALCKLKKCAPSMHVNRFNSWNKNNCIQKQFSDAQFWIENMFRNIVHLRMKSYQIFSITYYRFKPQQIANQFPRSIFFFWFFFLSYYRFNT